MSVDMAELPTGTPLPGWTPRLRPPPEPIQGRFCRIEALRPERHAAALFAANSADAAGRMWTYMGYGPFATERDYRVWMEDTCLGDDPLFHAVVDEGTGLAVGVAAFLRIEPAVGVIEVGHIAFSPALQRTPAATEAMWLMMRRVFDELGYRRYEWKCDSLNAASRAAATRLGFSYEGLFRQATVYKGRNRDTAWYALIDRDWPRIDRTFQSWLAPDNFDSAGRQRRSLRELTSVPEAHAQD